eukprot:TRINITY_DN11114_c0_g1_i1.p1 TRINITY_DN11114_c0_g1~~TRINITY_DN11114_c0_g1_i1.p1  ORF type:complete len:1517 (-),score=202.87 TRINITY_DN11114_c0_g1_i1:132-4682(-)
MCQKSIVLLLQIFIQHCASQEQSWAALQQSAQCTDCLIPVGQTWLLDVSANVRTLTIEGTLRWDTTKNGLVLTAGYVLVEPGGRFEIGTESNPMRLRAVITLTGGVSHPAFGTRFLGGSEGTVAIHGKPKLAWGLLGKSLTSGDSTLELQNYVQPAGWEVGDRIGIATTSRGSSAVRTISGIRSLSDGTTAIDLDKPVTSDHAGGIFDIGGKNFEIRTEIVNLERNIILNTSNASEGYHTIMANGGLYQLTYALLENCGQDRTLGKYCAHMHLIGQCPSCRVEGNAIFQSENVGITVHGTHRALIARNTLFNARPVGIYVEDGNEMNNTFEENVVICSDASGLGCQKDGLNSGGFYVIGMTNDFFRNRVVGYTNCFYTPGGAKGNGQGVAQNRVCPKHLPYGKFQGNVNHECGHFGLYVDNQFPRQVVRDENGYVADRRSCEATKANGEDNGQLCVIEDQLEYNNLRSGQYSSGDIQYLRLTSISVDSSMYWKASKNFADLATSHVKDSIFAGGRIGSYQFRAGPSFLGPAGPFTFVMENVSFYGTRDGVVIGAGQHCGLASLNNGVPGSCCSAQYVLKIVNFSGLTGGGGKYIQFGVSGGDAVAPTFTSFDSSFESVSGSTIPAGATLVSGYLDGFKDCSKLGPEWDDARMCRYPVRRLNLYGDNQGSLTLSGPGYEGVVPNMDAKVLGRNAGTLTFDGFKKCYGAVVKVGSRYNVSSPGYGDLKVEFSDPVMGARFPTDVLELEVQTDQLKPACRFVSGSKTSIEATCSWHPFKSAGSSSNVNAIAFNEATTQSLPTWADGDRKTNFAFNGNFVETLTFWRSLNVSTAEVLWNNGGSSTWNKPPSIRYRSASGNWSVVRMQGSSGRGLLDLGGALMKQFQVTGDGIGGLLEVILYGSVAIRANWADMPKLAKEGDDIGSAFWYASGAVAFDHVSCMERCEQTENCMSITFIQNYGCWLKRMCVRGDEENTNDAIRRTYYRTDCVPPKKILRGAQVIFTTRSADYYASAASASFEAGGGGFSAANAIDGQTSTSWMSQGSGRNAGDWLVVEWGDALAVGAVVIEWCNQFHASKYSLLMKSSAKEDWTYVLNMTEYPGSPWEHDLNGTTGRFLKLLGVQHATPHGLCVSEIAAYEPAQTTLVAEPGRVVGSATDTPAVAFNSQSWVRTSAGRHPNISVAVAAGFVGIRLEVARTNCWASVGVSASEMMGPNGEFLVGECAGGHATTSRFDRKQDFNGRPALSMTLGSGEHVGNCTASVSAFELVVASSWFSGHSKLLWAHCARPNTGSLNYHGSSFGKLDFTPLLAAATAPPTPSPHPSPAPAPGMPSTSPGTAPTLLVAAVSSRMTLAVNNPAAFVADPASKAGIEKSIADGISGVTPDMVNATLSLSRRLSERKLQSGSVQVNFTITQSTTDVSSVSNLAQSLATGISNLSSGGLATTIASNIQALGGPAVTVSVASPPAAAIVEVLNYDGSVYTPTPFPSPVPIIGSTSDFATIDKGSPFRRLFLVAFLCLMV